MAARPLTIGLQIRRGDACSRWAERGDHDVSVQRPCYKLEVYMAVARQMKALYGATRLAVATDSASVVEELHATPLAECDKCGERYCVRCVGQHLPCSLKASGWKAPCVCPATSESG